MSWQRAPTKGGGRDAGNERATSGQRGGNELATSGVGGEWRKGSGRIRVESGRRVVGYMGKRKMDRSVAAAVGGGGEKRSKEV